MSKRVRITLVRSLIGTPQHHRQMIRGLGLRHLHHSVERLDTPEVRGVLTKAGYLLKWETV